MLVRNLLGGVLCRYAKFGHIMWSPVNGTIAQTNVAIFAGARLFDRCQKQSLLRYFRKVHTDHCPRTGVRERSKVQGLGDLGD